MKNYVSTFSQMYILRIPYIWLSLTVHDCLSVIFMRLCVCVCVCMCQKLRKIIAIDFCLRDVKILADGTFGWKGQWVTRTKWRAFTKPLTTDCPHLNKANGCQSNNGSSPVWQTLSSTLFKLQKQLDRWTQHIAVQCNTNTDVSTCACADTQIQYTHIHTLIEFISIL